MKLSCWVLDLEFENSCVTQGLGYITANCPNWRVITLEKWDAVKEKVVEDKEDVESLEEEEDEIIAKADQGELLVLRRALNSQKNEKEEKRENIFHSRCAV